MLELPRRTSPVTFRVKDSHLHLIAEVPVASGGRGHLKLLTFGNAALVSRITNGNHLMAMNTNDLRSALAPAASTFHGSVASSLRQNRRHTQCPGSIRDGGHTLLFCVTVAVLGLFPQRGSCDCFG